MQLLIESSGNIRCLYDETVSLSAFGQLEIRRASHVEPTPDGCWQADLSHVNGPMLGPFVTRSQALSAEQQWLEANWLVASK